MLRRDFIKYTAIASMLISVKNIKASDLKSLTKKIVICGAGFAGLSVAKELKRLNPLLAVTIIEKRKSFSSCPFSNVWLGEVKNIKFEDLNFDYNKAISTFNYNFINETIIDINRNEKTIQTNNQKIFYDYMVLAPGIDYDYSKLFKEDSKKAKECYFKAPPGLKPGSEHLALKRMIENFKGGNFVITIPTGSYKCPPAPYERACMIANYFKNNNIAGKVIILDPREKPAAKAKSFQKAFKKFYSEIIEYKGLTNFKDVNFKSKVISVESFDKNSLEYESININFEEACIIPPNKANSLIQIAKIDTNDLGWAKLREPTFRSINDENVYVVGDAQGEYPYPKSAQMANSCGYLVAQEINKRVNNENFKYKINLPGNICYSMISNTKAVSISHLYDYSEKLKVSTITSDIDTHTADAALGWYKGLIEDILAIKI